jgi:hypothetical protein
MGTPNMYRLDALRIPGVVAVRRILGLDYVHVINASGDDLYVTGFGLPLGESLLPENLFSDKEWFQKNAVRMRGSATCYRVRTRPIRNLQRDIVLKWNRMGQNVPVQDVEEDIADFEFNSPFEEFSLLMELKNTRYESPGAIYTHKPLAIFVPHQRKDLDRLGRREYKMLPLIEAHKELELDMHRSYAVIYEWIKGIDAVEAEEQGFLDERGMVDLTVGCERKLRSKGFVVHDRKPHHLIVRPRRDGTLATDRNGEILYGLVDFELLKRTPQREDLMRDSKRKLYFLRKLERFNVSPSPFPEHLKQVVILGVDYVYGDAASTKGKLWVLGKSPDLFDYFIPERWEVTPRVRLRVSNEVYYTKTKDNIHIVWRVSNVGSKPDMDPFDARELRVLRAGYNSPFEEISLALYLRSKGISTISPLAVYMTGHRVEMADFLFDESRYQKYSDLLNDEGTPVLRRDRAYMTLWGDWNRPDYECGEKDGSFHQRMSALHAYRKKLINEETYFDLIDQMRGRLLQVGVEDLFPRGGHFLISVDSSGRMIRNERGEPELRLCDFELLKKL